MSRDRDRVRHDGGPITCMQLQAHAITSTCKTSPNIHVRAGLPEFQDVLPVVHHAVSLQKLSMQN
jgi:hypothetical protein